LADLIRQGIEISAEGRSATRSIALGEFDLQLYAIVSPVSLETESTEEWSLLLILKRSDDQPLPHGIQLEVYESCSNQVVQQVVSSDRSGYLFTDIIATQDETLIVTLSLADGTAIALSPMTFKP